jgi:SAM-dependent methyltransferase
LTPALVALRARLDLALTDEQLAAAARAADPARLGEPHERAIAADRAARRAAAVYYTPPHLVALAVARALPDAPRRVLDPACGAGAFLVAALRSLAALARAATPRARAAIAAGLDGLDVDPTAVELCRLALALAVLDGAPADALEPGELARAVAGVRVADTLDAELPLASYDAVLGNPPWGQKGFALPPARKAALRARYAAAAGRTDVAACFVERALELVRPGGRFVFVLPDVVLLKQHEPLRALLLERATIDHLAHSGRAFRGVGLDTAFLAGRRGAAPPRHEVEIWRTTPRDWAAAAPPAHRVAQALFARLPGRRFNLELDEPAAAALARLASLPQLADEFDVHEGVHSGNRRAALFCASPPDGPCAKLVVGGDELRAFRLRWDGAWVDLSPAAIDRARGGYASLGRPAWFAAGKLVVRRTGDRVVAARDADGLYVSNNAFVLVPRVPDEDVRAWLALLNASFATAWFRAQVPRVGRAFSELKIQDLTRLPRPADGAWRALVPALAALAADAEREAAAGRAPAAALAAIDRLLQDHASSLRPNHSDSVDSSSGRQNTNT